MTHEYGSARTNMVENQVRTNDVTDLPVQDAMRVVDRQRFCRPGKDYLAYAESPVEYAPGYALMAPRDVSKLLQALRPRPGDRALAICAPYAAAVMAEIGCDVVLRLPAGEPARAGRDAVAGSSVRVVEGDAAEVGDDAPYDILICEGAVAAAPAAWRDAVAVNGRLGGVERDGPVGKARLYLRGDDGLLARREIFDATPPLLPGFAAALGFAF